ncbi:ATP-binding protein [Oligoflexus tunisiensis]|uniref:ATP-binding protein n=1 Tax=Oligoflexus tunisiensis TaxID=708132 RepID=UPI00114CD078|nr:ATP-binding protein [Oligoflexus tunisiensis]
MQSTCLGILLTLLTWVHAQGVQAQEHATFELKDWEYHWGDFPVRPEPFHFQIPREQAHWTPFESPLLRPPGRGQHTIGWLRIRLPEHLELHNPAVFIPGFDLAAHVFLEDTLLFQYGSTEFEGFRHALIRLPADYKGSYLYVRLFSDHTNLGLFRGVSLGNHEQLIMDIIQSNAEMFGIGLFFLATALVMGLVFCLNWKRKEILALALTFVCSGFVLLFVPTNTLSQFFMPSYLFNHLLFQFSMYTVAIPYSLFVERMFPARKAHGFSLLRGVALTYAVGALTLSLGGWIPPMSTLLPGEILILIACAVVMTRVVQAVWHREPHSLIFGLGSLCLLIGTVRDVLVEMGLVSFATLPISLHYWVLFFFLCMIVALIRSITRTYDLADQYLGEVKRLNLQLEKKVEEQTLEIKMILQTIEQGILIVDQQGCIKQDHSHYALQLLGESELAGLSLDQAVLAKTDLADDQKQQIHHILTALIQEDILTWEVNSPAFPKSFHLKTNHGRPRAIEAEWTPFFDAEERISHILLTLRDVTEILQYRQEVLAHEEEWKNLEELVHVPADRFRMFMEQSLRLVHACQRALARDPIRDAFKVSLRHLHTLKGNARTLGLRRLSGAFHACEENLLRKRRSEDEASLHPMLLQEIQVLESLLHEYQRLNDSVLDRGGGSVSPSEKSKPRTLDSLIADCQPALARTAQSLNKPIPEVDLHGDTFVIPDGLYQDLKDAFLHLFNNALDHGLEDAETRQRSGKPAAGRIVLSVSLQNDAIGLEWRDDGRGLDLKALRKKMPTIQKDEELAALILEDDISTRNSVSEISGRGLGLAAVRQFCQDHGGSISIRLDPAQPGSDYRTFAFILKLGRALLEKDSAA